MEDISCAYPTNQTENLSRTKAHLIELEPKEGREETVSKARQRAALDIASNPGA